MQKRIVRYLFGDVDSYLNKLSTSARTRPFGMQVLGKEFYCKEHTKLLFSQQSLLTVQNLHTYMSINEIAKIITFGAPSLLKESISISSRNNNNLIILPTKSNAINQFHYTASNLWNIVIKKINIPNPHNIVIPVLKSKLKRYLLGIQNSGDDISWLLSNLDIRE